MQSPMIFAAGFSEAIDSNPQRVSALPRFGNGPAACHWFPVVGIVFEALNLDTDPGYGFDSVVCTLASGSNRIGSGAVQFASSGAYGSATSLASFGVRAANAGDVMHAGVLLDIWPTPTAEGQLFELTFVLRSHYNACDPPTREYGRARAPRGLR